MKFNTTIPRALWNQRACKEDICLSCKALLAKALQTISIDVGFPLPGTWDISCKNLSGASVVLLEGVLG